MDEQERAGWARRRRRRRLVVVAAVAVVALVVGGAVAGLRSAWWSCRTSTSLNHEAMIDYTTAQDRAPRTAEELVTAISDLPGVGELQGSAPLDVDVALAAGPDGTLLIGASPYFAEADTDRMAALDPATAETRWNRGQAGQAAAPSTAGDAVVSVAAVAEGPYRVTVLDGGTGGVRRCVDLERVGSAGIGQTAAVTSADGSALTLAVPAAEGSLVRTVPLDEGDAEWETALDERASALVPAGSTVVAGTYEADVSATASIDAENAWQTTDRVSLTALDAAGSGVLWTWPQDLSDGADPRVGTLVTAADPDPGVVVVRESGARGDAQSPPTRLVGLDPASGEELWARDTATAAEARFVGGVVLMDDGRTTAALDPASGTPLWEASTPTSRSDPERIDVERAQAWGEQVIAPTGAGGLVVLDPRSGSREVAAGGGDGGALVPTVLPEGLAVLAHDADGDQELLVFSRD